MRCTVHRGGTAVAGYEIALAQLPAVLVPHVESCIGYREWSASTVQRLEMPSGRAVLVFELGSPMSVGPPDATLVRHRGGFYGAIDDAPALTSFHRVQEGVQVNLTPRGAHALLGRNTCDFSGQIADLGALRITQSVVDELASARTWDARIEVVMRELLARFAGARDQSNVVRWAVERIDQAHGAVRIDSLSDELGFSRKHLHQRFLEEVGLPPKRYAALRRFARVVERLRAGGVVSLAQLAFEVGYSDQAHLAREVRRFSALNSTALSRSTQDPISVAVRQLISSQE